MLLVKGLESQLISKSLGAKKNKQNKQDSQNHLTLPMAEHVVLSNNPSLAPLFRKSR